MCDLGDTLSGVDFKVISGLDVLEDEIDHLTSLQTPEDFNHNQVSVSGRQWVLVLIKEKELNVIGTIFLYPGEPLLIFFPVVRFKTRHIGTRRSVLTPEGE